MISLSLILIKSIKKRKSFLFEPLSLCLVGPVGVGQPATPIHNDAIRLLIELVFQHSLVFSLWCSPLERRNDDQRIERNQKAFWICKFQISLGPLSVRANKSCEMCQALARRSNSRVLDQSPSTVICPFQIKTNKN